MKAIFKRKRFLLIGIFGVLVIAVLACSLFIYSNSFFSIYPNADFAHVQDLSISRDTFPFIITAPGSTLPPCVRASYSLVFHTGDKPGKVAQWFQENGWSTGVGNNRASGMRSSVTDLPFVNFAN